MYAIIETGGKQLRVAEGDVIRTDLIDQEVGATVTFDRVVLSSNGSAVNVGAPIVTGAVVLGTVLRQAKDKKILVFRYKPKKRVRKLNGLFQGIEGQSYNDWSKDLRSRDIHGRRDLVDDGRRHEETVRFQPASAGSNLRAAVFRGPNMSFDLAEMIGADDRADACLRVEGIANSDSFCPLREAREEIIRDAGMQQQT